VSNEVISPKNVWDRLTDESSANFSDVLKHVNGQLGKVQTLQPIISVPRSIPEVTIRAALDKYRASGWDIRTLDHDSEDDDYVYQFVGVVS
jgi:hypothetical protein